LLYLSTAPQAAKLRKPVKVFMPHPKKARLSWILVVVLDLLKVRLGRSANAENKDEDEEEDEHD
jgi:hypothetical protein